MLSRACLLLSLLSLASALDFKYSTLLTSADIPINQPMKYTNLKQNGIYRIYAIYNTMGDENYARNVVIYDDTGASFNVAGLSNPNPNTEYFLDNMRTLRAPITIHDKNMAKASTSYTIYIVDATIASYPVVSARKNEGQVDSGKAFIAAGVTVLSAEPFFTMNSFDLGGISKMVISSVGFDDNSNQYNLLSIDSRQASQSFITISGPIATLFNTNWGWDARFKFTFSRQTYNYALAPGAATAVMSPGYLSTALSYRTDYTNGQNSANQNKDFSFGQNCYLEADWWIYDLQGNENVMIRFATSDGSNTDRTINSNSYTWQWQWAKTLSVIVNNNSPHVPRFLVQIYSSANLSFSFIGLIVVSLFSQLY